MVSHINLYKLLASVRIAILTFNRFISNIQNDNNDNCTTLTSELRHYFEFRIVFDDNRRACDRIEP